MNRFDEKPNAEGKGAALSGLLGWSLDADTVGGKEEADIAQAELLSCFEEHSAPELFPNWDMVTSLPDRIAEWGQSAPDALRDLGTPGVEDTPLVENLARAFVTQHGLPTWLAGEIAAEYFRSRYSIGLKAAIRLRSYVAPDVASELPEINLHLRGLPGESRESFFARAGEELDELRKTSSLPRGRRPRGPRATQIRSWVSLYYRVHVIDKSEWATSRATVQPGEEPRDRYKSVKRVMRSVDELLSGRS
ncbi:MAG: hypothetical protein ACR2HN_09565 [Tepidiformaceae bacterium]